jgi:hypothetical protein
MICQTLATKDANGDGLDNNKGGGKIGRPFILTSRRRKPLSIASSFKLQLLTTRERRSSPVGLASNCKLGIIFYVHDGPPGTNRRLSRGDTQSTGDQSRQTTQRDIYQALRSAMRFCLSRVNQRGLDGPGGINGTFNIRPAPFTRATGIGLNLPPTFVHIARCRGCLD